MKKKEIYYHIAGWLLYVLYLILGEVLGFTGNKVSIFNYTFVLVKIIEFYICYLWVYPRFLNKGNIPKLIGGILVALSCFIMLRFLLEQVVTDYLFNMTNYFGYTISYYIVDNIYFGTSGIVLSAAIYSSFSSLYKQEENKSLREEKIQAELAFLKTQINPHFLYNTLNYIYSLAYPVSEKLGDAVIKLSQLMRYMLTESAAGDVDLQKEVDYIENYISIYQLRFADAFFVDFKAEGDIAGKRVAALLLIPFVENAFKHGIVNDPSRPVRIRLKITGNRLAFTVSNQISRGQKDHSTGVGLPNIRRRLELIYPNRHELLISENGQTYKTTLNIQLD
ncbi:sensor histidine kinase [Mucilaginibacter lacusdianchii]|uniref:sensor histidine kinase n=1 Tax=Mucilaginibacter lacusdianchii TaxID=2684211 RepID=UPI00131B322A|nr:histidine kinase [Mucilaginibacter sp. JXJ CY 39]